MKHEKGIPCGNMQEFDAIMFGSPKALRAPMDNLTVILKRTFNQSDFQGGFYRNWRIIGPATHRSLNSDLAFCHVDANGNITYRNPLKGETW